MIMNKLRHIFTLRSYIFAAILFGGVLLIALHHPLAYSKSIAKGNLVTQVNDAYQYLEMGQDSQALEALKSISLLLESAKVNDHNREVINATRLDVSLGLAEAYLNLGFYERALDSLLAVKPLLNQSSVKDANMRWLNLSGNVYLAMGQFDYALEALEQAVKLAKSYKERGLIALQLNDYANGLWLAGSSVDAELLYKDSLLLAEQAKMPSLKVSALLNLAHLYIQTNELGNAFKSLLDATEIIRSLPSAPIASRIKLSRLKLDLYQHDSSLQSLTEVEAELIQTRELAEGHPNIKHSEQAFIYGYLGKVYETQKKNQLAQRYTQQALAVSANSDPSRYLWHWQLGRIMGDVGKIEQAVLSLTTATEQLNDHRSTLARGMRRANNHFQHYVKPVYIDLINLLITQVKKTKSSTEKVRLLKQVQTVSESLKGAELEDYFQDECVANAKASISASGSGERGFVEADNGRTAIIYPIILEHSLELLVHLPSGLSLVSVPVKAERLLPTINHFREQVQNESSERYTPYARRLHRWLIDPLEETLTRAQVDTLVFVPEGGMRTIPYAALMKKNTFLIERYAIAITPGLELTGQKPFYQSRTKPLIGGISEARQGYLPLSYVDEELKNVQGSIGGKILKNKDYTVMKLQEELSDSHYNVIHMATHGVFAGSVDHSFLLTYDEKLSLNELEHLLRVKNQRQSEVELLTLSACETAVGDERAGLGFAGMAIKAGVQSAVASFWLVDDQASSVLMPLFYQQLRQGKNAKLTKAKALKNAQLQVLAMENYLHPSHWAAFALIGNWK